MRTLLLFVCSLLMSYSAWGQDSTSVRQLPTRMVLKVAPLALIEFDPMVQLGLEYRMAKRHSLQAEAGYGWSGLGFSVWGSDYTHQDSWRVRTELRKYSGRFQTNKRKNIDVRTNYPLGNYWALELFWKEFQVLKN